MTDVALMAAGLVVENLPGIAGTVEILDFDVNGISVDDIDMSWINTTGSRPMRPGCFRDPGTVTLRCQWTATVVPTIAATSDDFVLKLVWGAVEHILLDADKAYLKSVSNMRGATGGKVEASLEVRLSTEIAVGKARI